MGMVLLALGVLCSIAGFIAGIFILIDAFQDEIWKGVVSLFCGLYLLYYALVEMDRENKWILILIWLGGSVAGGVLTNLGAGMGGFGG